MCLHTGSMEDQFLFMKVILMEEEIFFHHKNKAAFLQCRIVFKKLMGKQK